MEGEVGYALAREVWNELVRSVVEAAARGVAVCVAGLVGTREEGLAVQGVVWYCLRWCGRT